MTARDDAAFTADALRFLGELEANNTREWFQANKQRYERSVLDPALRFIASMQDPLHEVAPHFTAVAKRVGGSLMRVYRDTRFAKDKTPYKTNIGIQFRHERAKDVHAPGFYLHVEAAQAFVGVGLWHPAADALADIRRRIDEKPAAWRQALAERSFARRFELAGEALKRPPRGFAADHPLVEDLKRKDYIAVHELLPADIVAPGLRRKVVAAFADAAPFMRFLCKALGLRY